MEGEDLADIDTIKDVQEIVESNILLKANAACKLFLRRMDDVKKAAQAFVEVVVCMHV